MTRKLTKLCLMFEIIHKNARPRRIALTGEFVHPSMIYFMKIHANMRRLAVGAALSEAG